MNVTVLRPVTRDRGDGPGPLNEAKLASAVNEAAAVLRASAEGGAVLEAMMGGGWEQALARLDWGEWTRILAATEVLLADEATRQADLALEELEDADGNGEAVVIAPGANVLPQAQRWAAENAARMVTVVTESSRLAIRETIGEAVRRGTSMPDAARLLRDVVGLNRPQARTVANLRARLIADGRKPSSVDRLVGAHARRLHRQRALTIARTEIQGAVNNGRLMAWQEAALRGNIGPDAIKGWETGSDPCAICAGNSAEEVVGLQTAFASGHVVPPAHPRCRCAPVIRKVGTLRPT